MMLITAFLNTLSPGTITGGLTVALATRHRMQYMQKVRHKSRTFGVHYLDLRPNLYRLTPYKYYYIVFPSIEEALPLPF